jgi:hypothetical protein
MRTDAIDILDKALHTVNFEDSNDVTRKHGGDEMHSHQGTCSHLPNLGA